jgi:hypothetical protein
MEAVLMRVTHYARQSVAAGVLALALGGCGKDSSGPSEFNPQGTSADMSAATAAFATQQMSSYAVLGGDISAVLNASPVVKSSALAVRGLDATRAARDLAAIVPRRGAFQASVTSIPATLLGTTFVWDVTTDTYVASGLAGAPSAGVRFKLYAVDPVMLRPVEPLVEVGYVDITDHSTLSAVDVNVKVVEGGVVYLAYEVTAHATVSGGVLEIAGFASNGSTLANFDLAVTVSDVNNSPVIGYAYHVDVPTRDLTLDWTVTISSISATEVATTLDLVINGPNGNVHLAGTYGVSERTLTVRVNGTDFATVNLDGADPVITGADGQPLDADDEASLQAIVAFYLNSGGMLDGLSAL